MRRSTEVANAALYRMASSGVRFGRGSAATTRIAGHGRNVVEGGVEVDGTFNTTPAVELRESFQVGSRLFSEIGPS